MCTGVRFSDSKGNMYFGRNLDWTVSYGQEVVITPRRFKWKTGFSGEVQTKYAIIGMAIVEENTPLYFDCINEAGLGIAGLNFPGYTFYAKEAMNNKTNVAAYEFPLWVAANFETVDDVERALKNTVIVSKPINEKFPVSELHYIIGDAKRSIVVEYTEKGMEIFHNDVDILTNQPGYAWHKENLRNYMNLDSVMPKKIRWGEAEMVPFGSGSMMRGLPGDYYAPSRFVRAAYLNTHYPTKDTEAENVMRLFHTLGSVAMIDGAAVAIDGKFEYTIYTSCYSTASKTYYYNTYDNINLRHVTLTKYDLDGSDLIKIEK